MNGLIRELMRRNSVLAWTALAHLGLFVILAIISLFDSTTILGINRWIKPMKFSSSIAIYAATIAWFMGYLPKEKLSIKLISRGIAVCMIVEIICIVLQPARGTTSHFNNSTPFDGMIFSLMGFMIVLNTVLDGWLLVLFFKERPQIPSSYLWGIRLGLALFMVAGLEGIMMVVRLSHSVGVTDGGAGLPFLNWSTEGGDLRVAHFFGLHSLQVLPVVGFLLHKLGSRFPSINPVALTWVFAFIYVSTFALLLRQAIGGRPLYAGL